MAEESSIHSANIGKNQAVDNDYSSAVMPVDRGHLCPSSHLHDQNSTWATFTLTNIVPQYSTLNQGAWREYEDTTMRNKTNGRVNIPSTSGQLPAACTDTFSSSSPAKLIDKKSFGREMAEESSIHSANIGKNQAVDNDYSSAVMPVDRGHLCPSSHLHDQNSTWATFTLTNIVPQYSTLNQGAWREYEDTTMRNKTNGCNTTYVITGAVPGNTNVTNGRVNIPSHIWSAACCLVGTNPTRAWGAIAKNERGNDQVTNLNLGRLERKLSELYGGKDVTLFNNACPRQ
ncbi:uncharacterized protein LOC130248359 [Oenanthe melanoleuca]|uniref:uncharacterized protein LOC130248359 n=1 Tax=Oenanthe melanoleuca TaxID=2939378 RepID=UPI0024C182C0|nr:uncharacterized protein LOC130248359 [Oenanthe melanoleuca]